MTTEQVNGILSNFDNICKLMGKPSLTSTINTFGNRVPDATQQTVVLSQIKEDVAKALADGLDKAQSELGSVETNEKLKDLMSKMGPQADTSTRDPFEDLNKKAAEAAAEVKETVANMEVPPDMQEQ